MSRRDAQPTVLITDSDLGSPRIEREICAAAGFELVEANCRTEAETVRAIRETEPSALLVQYAPITATVVREAPSVRAIARYGVGLDSIDLDSCSEAGVAVFNVPDYAIAEVADHALALALLLTRQAPTWTAASRAGEWLEPDAPPAPLRALGSMTFGLAGFGRIARAVAERARGFGATVGAHDPFLSAAAVEDAGVAPVPWEELWATADLVSLHMPLTAGTEGIVDRGALRSMRPGSYLVNTARAALVDRDALEEAVEAGWLAGAALDVWWREPPDPEDLLLRHPRLVVTPHVAYLSNESLPRLRRLATERLIGQLTGDDDVPSA